MNLLKITILRFWHLGYVAIKTLIIVRYWTE
jgi:hypothetical protein